MSYAEETMGNYIRQNKKKPCDSQSQGFLIKCVLLISFNSSFALHFRDTILIMLLSFVGSEYVVNRHSVFWLPSEPNYAAGEQHRSAPPYWGAKYLENLDSRAANWLFNFSVSLVCLYLAVVFDI